MKDKIMATLRAYRKGSLTFSEYNYAIAYIYMNDSVPSGIEVDEHDCVGSEEEQKVVDGVIDMLSRIF